MNKRREILSGGGDTKGDEAGGAGGSTGQQRKGNAGIEGSLIGSEPTVPFALRIELTMSRMPRA